MTKMLSECSRGCNATVVRSVFINMVLHIVRCPQLHTDHRYTGTAVVAHHNGLCVGACCRLCVVLIPTLCPPLWWRVIELRWLTAPAAALASAPLDYSGCNGNSRQQQLLREAVARFRLTRWGTGVPALTNPLAESINRAHTAWHAAHSTRASGAY
jgi:hypothetical protein